VWNSIVTLIPSEMIPLGSRVKAALAREPGLIVIISADGEVRHHAVVEVMDEMRLAGVGRLAIAVRPDRKARP
jgi:biopolymer transport protein ExbD